MLERRIKRDGCHGCHEATTVSAEDTAPLTGLTLSTVTCRSRQCPQPDEKQEITENHWKSLKLKKLTSPPVHTKSKTTERNSTFANFFSKAKGIHFGNIYSSEYIFYHSTAEQKPTQLFIRLIAVLIRSLLITTGA